MQQAHITCQISVAQHARHNPGKQTHHLQVQSNSGPTANSKGQHNLSGTAGPAQHQRQYHHAASTHDMPSHTSRNMQETTPSNRLTGCRSNQIAVQQPTDKCSTTCQPQLVQHNTNSNMTVHQAHIACHVTSHSTCLRAGQLVCQAM
jgi:hypothetical protein